MSYGKIIIIVAFTFAILGCTERTSKLEGKYGHWKYKGSSTFPQVFQCVQEFKPHQNKQCD
jgi:hypothetical protein